jgi:hypothetical protein
MYLGAGTEGPVLPNQLDYHHQYGPQRSGVHALVMIVSFSAFVGSLLGTTLTLTILISLIAWNNRELIAAAAQMISLLSGIALQPNSDGKTSPTLDHSTHPSHPSTHFLAHSSESYHLGSHTPTISPSSSNHSHYVPPISSGAPIQPLSPFNVSATPSQPTNSPYTALSSAIISSLSTFFVERIQGGWISSLSRYMMTSPSEPTTPTVPGPTPTDQPKIRTQSISESKIKDLRFGDSQEPPASSFSDFSLPTLPLASSVPSPTAFVTPVVPSVVPSVAPSLAVQAPAIFHIPRPTPPAPTTVYRRRRRH